MEFLIIICHFPMTLVDDFDVGLYFGLGKWVLEPLAQGHHESVEALEFWRIIIVERDHPLCFGIFQSHGHAPAKSTPYSCM